jgi:hypothetical protein
MIEMELKDLILRRYKSIREFAIDINMPYSTIDSLFKRGVNTGSLSNIIRICSQLGISPDALGQGVIAFTKENSVRWFSRLISAYEKADIPIRQSVCRVLDIGYVNPLAGDDDDMARYTSAAERVLAEKLAAEGKEIC